MFNVDSLLNTQFDQATSTEYLKVPEGEYLGMTKPVTSKSFRTADIKKGERVGEKITFFDLEWEIQDDALKQEHGRVPVVRQSLILDLSSDGTAVAFGKGQNVKLGLIRKAFNQNQDGRPWNFTMLGGQMAKVRVKHRLDPDDSSKVYSEVTEVGATR